MERSFRRSFEDVRVHDDAAATHSAQRLNADAFTLGHHIAFGAGRYRPESEAGDRLLAHELAHVVQEDGREAAPSAHGAVSMPHDALEREAEAAANRVNRGQAAEVRPAPKAVSTRQRIMRQAATTQPTAATAPALQSQAPTAEKQEDGGSWFSLSSLKRAAARKVVVDPVYRLLTFAIRYDLIADAPVQPSLEGVAEAVFALIPGGQALYEDLRKNQVLPRAKAWLDAEREALGLRPDAIVAQFRAQMTMENVARVFSDPVGLIDDTLKTLAEPVARLWMFAERVVRKLGSMLLEVVAERAGPIGRKLLDVFQRAGDVATLIWKDPLQFLQNLFRALGRGAERFSDKIVSHIKTGLLEWVFGTLEAAGITLPAEWTLESIAGLALDLLGISYDKVRTKLAERVGPEKVALVEKAIAFVRHPAETLATLEEYVGKLPGLIFDKLKDWAVGAVVRSAIVKLASLLNPAGAIIQAIVGIYSAIEVVRDRITAFLDMMDSVVTSLGNIALGKLDDAAVYVEKTLARMLPVALDFLARFLGLGNIAERIREIILQLQDRVNKAIDAVLDRIVAAGGTVWRKTVAWVKKHGPTQVDFDAGGQQHELWVAPRAGRGELMMSSELALPLDDFLKEAAKNPKVDKAELPKLEKLLGQLKEKLTHVDLSKLEAAAVAPAQESRSGGKSEPRVKADRRLLADLAEVLGIEAKIAESLKRLLKGIGHKTLNVRRALEGLVGPYTKMVTQTDDKMTPDHQPQAALIQYIADLPEFANTKAGTVAAGHANHAWTINIHHKRHVPGRTYGKGIARLESKPKAAIDNVLKAHPAPKGAPKKPKAPDTNARDEAEKARVSAVQVGVIAVAKEELQADVNAMLGVISSDDHFSDVDEEYTDATKRTEVKKELRKQITRGETEILHQPLDELKQPKE